MSVDFSSDLNSSTGLIVSGMGNEVLKAIAKVLRTNKTVRSIDFTDNETEDGGIGAIAEVLRVNKTVSSVNIGALTVSLDFI